MSTIESFKTQLSPCRAMRIDGAGPAGENRFFSVRRRILARQVKYYTETGGRRVLRGGWFGRLTMTPDLSIGSVIIELYYCVVLKIRENSVPILNF